MSSSNPSSIPVVVDLDGTLISTDLLVETANGFVTRQHLRALRMLAWLLAGKCELKTRLAEACGIDPAHLPYNQALLSWLHEQKELGRRLVLATASHLTLAEAVAHHLGIFDEVLASQAGTNLKGSAKRDALVDRYGERGFDYVGNEAADLVVWRSARRAYVVGSSPRLIRDVQVLGTLGRVFHDARPSAFGSLLKAMRLHQWLKNLLVLVPLLAAHRYGDPASLVPALLAFLAFGLAASGVYLLNDLADVAADRQHPRKRRRPFAAGHLSLLHGWLAWPVLQLAAFSLAALALPPAFLAWLAAYFVLTLAYSLVLKRIVLVDVLTLAGLYTLRIVAGASAIGVTPSFWLLAFSTFFFLSLAFIKRYSEIKAGIGSQGKVHGRGYLHGDLETVSSLGIGAGQVSVLVLALYIQDSHTAVMYHSPEFIWLACPLLLYWVSRAWLIAHRGGMHDDPLVFAIKDPASWLIGLGFGLAFALARMAP